MNTLAWNWSGDYILSGSDDFNLCITKPNLCDFNEKDFVVKHKILSGHRANIFSAQFMPFTSDTKITSCSSSGSIIVTDVNSPETSGTCLFECHKYTCYEVAPIHDQPNVFMSCSEDKTIRLFDLRTTQSCLSPNCQKNILIRGGYSTTTISINPTNPEQFLVGRSDGIGVLFDRRKISKDSDLSYSKNEFSNHDYDEVARKRKNTYTLTGDNSSIDHNRSANSNNNNNKNRVRRLNHPAHGAVAKFTVPGFTDTHRFTSLCFSPDGREVLASYSSDYIYLFNVDRSSNITLNKRIDRLNGAHQSTETRSGGSGGRGDDDGDDDKQKQDPAKTAAHSELQRRTFRVRGDWSDTGPNSRPMGPFNNNDTNGGDSEPEVEPETRDQRQSFMSRLTRAANEGLRTVRNNVPGPPVFIDIRGILNRGGSTASTPATAAAATSATPTTGAANQDTSLPSQTPSQSEANSSSAPQQTRQATQSRSRDNNTTSSPVEFLWDQTFSFTTDDETSDDEALDEDEDHADSSADDWYFGSQQHDAATSTPAPANGPNQLSDDRLTDTRGSIGDTRMRNEARVSASAGSSSSSSSSSRPEQSSFGPSPQAAQQANKRGKNISEATKLKFSQSFRKTLEAVMQIPSYQPKKIFKGHRNCRTAINEATFWGSDYIVSGSDCGHIFMWDKHTGEVVMIFQGDERVVNCIAPNPKHYCLATSGIDYDIKLWSTQFQEHEPLCMTKQKKQKIVKINEQMIREDSNTITMPPHVFFRLLASLASARIMAVESGNVNEGLDIRYE